MITLGKSLEIFDILGPVILDVFNFHPRLKRFPYIIRTTDFVEHRHRGVRVQEGVMGRIEFIDCLKYIELGKSADSGLIISIMELNSMDKHILVGTRERLEVDCAEHGTRDFIFIELCLERVGVDPLCREDGKREGVAYSYIQE